MGLCEQSQQGGEDDDFGDVPFPPGQQIEGEQSDDGGAPGKDTVYQIVCSAQVNHDGGDDSQCCRAHACHDIFQSPTVLELFKEYGGHGAQRECGGQNTQNGNNGSKP